MTGRQVSYISRNLIYPLQDDGKNNRANMDIVDIINANKNAIVQIRVNKLWLAYRKVSWLNAANF
jgi:hypothetical protein